MSTPVVPAMDPLTSVTAPTVLLLAPTSSVAAETLSGPLPRAPLPAEMSVPALMLVPPL